MIPTVIAALCMMFFPDRGIDDMFAPVKPVPATAPSNP
jgi:hypothetical protein